MSRPDGAWLGPGIGNVLLRDEGVGVHVARVLVGESGASEPRAEGAADGAAGNAPTSAGRFPAGREPVGAPT